MLEAGEREDGWMMSIVGVVEVMRTARLGAGPNPVEAWYISRKEHYLHLIEEPSIIALSATEECCQRFVLAFNEHSRPLSLLAHRTIYRL